MTRRLLGPALAALLALAACSSNTPSTAAPAPTSAAAAPSSAGATPASCPNGRLPNGNCAGGTAAAPSASPTPNLPPLSELATCRQIVPLLSTVADAATALGNGSSPDVTQLKGVEGQLRQVRDRAPEDMRGDLDVVILAATTMQIGNLDGTSLQQSAISLLQRCRKYAS